MSWSWRDNDGEKDDSSWWQSSSWGSRGWDDGNWQSARDECSQASHAADEMNEQTEHEEAAQNADQTDRKKAAPKAERRPGGQGTKYDWSHKKRQLDYRWGKEMAQQSECYNSEMAAMQESIVSLVVDQTMCYQAEMSFMTEQGTLLREQDMHLAHQNAEFARANTRLMESQELLQAQLATSVGQNQFFVQMAHSCKMELEEATSELTALKDAAETTKSEVGTLQDELAAKARALALWEQESVAREAQAEARMAEKKAAFRTTLAATVDRKQFYKAAFQCKAAEAAELRTSLTDINQYVHDRARKLRRAESEAIPF